MAVFGLFSGANSFEHAVSWRLVENGEFTEACSAQCFLEEVDEVFQNCIDYIYVRNSLDTLVANSISSRFIFKS